MADASTWKRETDTLDLSKGPVKAIRPDLFALVMTDESNTIPDGLSSRILDRFKPDDSQKKKKQAEPWQPEKKDLAGMYKFIQLMVTAALVEPRIVDKPNYANGEIEYDDLSMEDKIKVFEYAMPGEFDGNTQRQNGSS
jgi:hypothetical protein